MLALLALLLGFQSGDLESLIRDLGDESLEVRERAHRRLLESGEAAVPALQAATRSADAEVRHRATILAEAVGRVARERAHDADQKSALLLLRRDVKAESNSGSGASEGARFDLRTTPFDGGWIVSTEYLDYFARRIDEGPGRGRLRFDIRSILDAQGKELTVERCGRCSPRRVFVRGGNGALNVRIQGTQTWFSPYNLEFKNPVLGQTARVGDFTIEVKELSLAVSSPADFPYDWISSMNAHCALEWKPGVVPPARSRGRTIRCGGGWGRAVGEKKIHWCDCPSGPQPVAASGDGPMTRSFGVASPVEALPVADINETADAPLTHQDCARITYTFWKPITTAIDLTVRVSSE